MNSFSTGLHFSIQRMPFQPLSMWLLFQEELEACFSFLYGHHLSRVKVNARLLHTRACEGGSILLQGFLHIQTKE